MIQRILVLFFITVLPATGFAQDVITVTDPELEFTLTKPSDWHTYNDDYYYYVYNPAVRDALVTITYTEASPEKDTQHYFDFTVEVFFPNNVPGFEVLATGDDLVQGEKAKWVKYKSIEKGIERINLFYTYVQNGQTFKLSGSARAGDFEKVSEDLLSILRSVYSEKI